MPAANKIFLLLLIYVISAAAQDGTDLPFLNEPVSPQLNGAGAAGTALLNDDPYGFLYNPAHLGMPVKNIEISAGFYPANIKWHDNIYIHDSYLNSYSFNAGYNLAPQLNGTPVSIGIGYAKSEMNYSLLAYSPEVMWSSVGKNNIDSYEAYSIGAGYNSIVSVNAGITYKRITTRLDKYYGGDNTSRVKAFDFGILLSTEINKLISQPFGFSLNSKTITPHIYYSLGFTARNVGDRHTYFENNTSIPIARTASLGHSVKTDIELNTKCYNVKILSLLYSINSDDILVKGKGVDTLPEYYNTLSFQGIMGDIKPFKNLFLGKGDPEVTLHKGFSMEIAEAFVFSAGGVSRAGKYNNKTSGYGVKLKGILKLVNVPLKNKILDYLIAHVDMQYYNSDYSTVNYIKNKYEGVVIKFTNFL